MNKRRWGGFPKTVERQGWRDRALQGRIHGRVLGKPPHRRDNSQAGPRQTHEEIEEVSIAMV